MSILHKTKVAESILLDPSLFDEFHLIKYGIPFFKNKEEIDILVKSDGHYKLGDYKIKKHITDDEDFSEKTYLINNYKNWENQKELTFDQNAPIRVILDVVLIKALLMNVSDIHFDIQDTNSYLLRFKVDTVLNPVCVLSKSQGEAVIMRLKVLSEIDTSKKHIPHSSSFYRMFRNQDIDFRFSTHPTFLGERCVIRVLQPKNVLAIDEIGLSEDVLDIAKQVIKAPSGLVVFTGPTNSGKTTTIHSILKEISNQSLNIMTLEDPVEYRIPGIVQTTVSENGLSFFDGMRSILRQDPDVIFLGEIRDEKTAQIAVQAAMTGHKVFTTLHAYSVKGALSRLSDMGVSMKLLAESVFAVFSQRLLRKLEKGTENYKGLALVSDGCLFDEKTKDVLRSGSIPNIENNLKKISQEMVEKGITKMEEVNRVIG